jgi:putative oxidoreductase
MLDATTAPWAALILRVALGILFLAHGLLKLLVFKPAGAYGYFKSLGLPGALAYVTIAAELTGGSALILGIVRATWRCCSFR